ncbi:MAG: hypothetical protein AAB527_02050 [Patescibacteria group bacterium]
MHKTLREHVKLGRFANGYLLAGRTDANKLADFLKTHGEVRRFEGEISIDTIRRIKEMSARSLGQAERAFFILDATEMNYYAFTAMLKVVEDARDRHFIILAERPEAVPATLRSRLVEVAGDGVLAEKRDDVSDFLKAEYAKRTAMIENIAEDRNKFNLFLDALELWVLKTGRHDLLPKMRLARESSLTLNIGRKMCAEYLTHLL